MFWMAIRTWKYASSTHWRIPVPPCFALSAVCHGRKEIEAPYHNKAFIVDNTVAIAGGRNIADDYFQAGPELNYADMDILAVGPITKPLSAVFDEYWNHPLAVPVSAFVSNESRPEDLEKAHGLLEKHRGGREIFRIRQAGAGRAAHKIVERRPSSLGVVSGTSARRPSEQDHLRGKTRPLGPDGPPAQEPSGVSPPGGSI